MISRAIEAIDSDQAIDLMKEACDVFLGEEKEAYGAEIMKQAVNMMVRYKKYVAYREIIII